MLGGGAILPAQAQQAPPPASVPAVLSTRDPSSLAMPGTGRARGANAVSVITAPAKASASASSAGAAAAEFAAADAATSKIKVHGLTGTLNKGDVHQTMEARQNLFDACIQESRRTLRWVSGGIKFAFKVDGEGRIMELRPLASTIGHRDLERCLTEAVLSTQFPKPSGRATAEFTWGMAVDPATQKSFDEAKAKIMARVARKEAKETFGSCEIKRRKARFRITAYIAAGGHLLSAGAVPTPFTAEDKVDCVLDQFSKWHMPKVKKASKVSFDLR
ncbi:MAG TPA: AgmX/PglI C-terminal domain-containing protein [Polyangiales bacterium]|nr:AgmX/PglI C-terminal domain-containing protein [Polyangiales bacterium]